MIKLSDISRRFKMGEQWIQGLDSVNLDIEAGEYIAVTGPSGSGKSTLLNLLGLLDRADQGDYHLFGQEVNQLAEEQRADLRAKHVGFVFQSFHLIPRLSAAQNIALPLTLANVEPVERDARVEVLLNKLNLDNRGDHRPDQLSGGQRQRVAIARAIVSKPKLLLADEPTGNLDSRSSIEVIELLESLNDDGITLLMVTHDPALARRASRQLTMQDGKICTDTLLAKVS